MRPPLTLPNRPIQVHNNRLTRISHSVLKDARDYQILFLSLFLALGIGTRDWTLRPWGVGTIVVTCWGVQWLCAWGLQHWGSKDLVQSPGGRPGSNLNPPAFNWRSPLITALGLSLLLRGDRPSTLALAATLAIASKFLLRYGGKHFFNPANLGIIAALVLTPDAWVSPGQWGDDLWYGLVFLGAGGIVLGRVGRLETTVAFLGSYGALEALRNLWLGWTWDVWFHRLSSGSLLLFALFMVTDPRAIPNHPRSRVIWAMAIAALTFYLRNYCFMSTAVFWALFLLSPLTPVLDGIWRNDRFSWQQTPDVHPNPDAPLVPDPPQSPQRLQSPSP
ncbi:RnfABCDGE type electron transport complex subunit D [Prochlorothrix hollandica]|uniref:RnfABCDGE type electron transport complex subunit D n=2 Tax=Prochlorothrix hollandica TaxID=1223 RepID=UPI000344F278|nr:RnfABCDGE type electron transport complex subunit D [Prochlorothrix hollandica]